MIKFALYALLTVIGVIGALASPLAGAIAAIEAYLMNPTIFGFPYDIHYQQVTAIAFALGVVMHLKHGPKRVGMEGMLMVSLWIFLLIAEVIAFNAQISSYLARQYLFEVVKTVIIATLLLRSIHSERDLRFFMVACAIGVFHAAALHVIGPKLGYISMSHSREYGVLSDDQRPVMAIFIPLLVVMAGTGPSKFERLLAFCALPIAIDSIVNTYQRTGFVALGVEALLLLLLGGGRILKRVIPVGIVAGILFFTQMTPDKYWSWMSTIADPYHEGSALSRFEINKASLKMLADYPFGVGYRNYTYISQRYLSREWLSSEGARSSHNSFFTILCETGIPGFIFWIIPFAGSLIILRKVRKAYRKTPHLLGNYALALEVGLYGWLVSGWTQGDQEVDPAYWFVALAIIIVRLHHANSTAAAAPPAAVPMMQPAMPPRLTRPRPAVVSTVVHTTSIDNRTT